MKILEETVGRTKKGTPNYMAPEVKANDPDAEYETEVDIYSICATFFFLIKGSTHNQINYKDLTEEDFPVPAIVKLINYNLTINRQGRMTASKILSILYCINEDDVPDKQLAYAEVIEDSQQSVTLPSGAKQ